MSAPTPAEALKVRPYPDLLSEEEGQALLTRAEELWADLQANNLGGFSGINRPFWIEFAFKGVIEAFGRRDVGLSWSKDEIDAATPTPDAGEVREKVARAKASLLHLEMFAEGDDIKRVRDAIAAIALLAPSPTLADAGEVRTYREGVEASAALVEAFPTEILHFWERPGGPPGNGYAPTTHADLAAAIRKLP